MADPSSTVIAIKKTTFARLKTMKIHPKQTHSEVIDILMDSYGKKKVTMDAEN